MNTGHDGSLSTGHANSAYDMLSRLETMVLSGEAGLPLEAIRQQIASAVDIIVHLSRMRDKTRKTMEICKKRAEPQKKDFSPLFRSLERALEKRGSDLRVPAASILFPYALFVSFVPALLSVP